MGARHPELTTFGAVMRFAASLEEEAAKRYEAWMPGVGDDLRGRFSMRASAHHKRAAQLQRIVQEQLNEMTLEPITGLSGEDYPVAVDVSGDQARDPVTLATEIEASLAKLHEDLTARAGQALGSATRTLRRFAADSQLAIQQLREP